MNIFVQLLQIITLKRRPSEISYDPSIAIIVFLATIATAYVQAVVSNTFNQQPLPFVAIQAVIQAVIFWVLLKLRNKENRFVQTITALFGVAAILQFIGIFLLQSPILIGFGLVLSIWNLYLMVIILNDAIECGIYQSVVITIIYHFVIGMILLTIFPELFEQIQATLNAQNS